MKAFRKLFQHFMQEERYVPVHNYEERKNDNAFGKCTESIINRTWASMACMLKERRCLSVLA